MKTIFIIIILSLLTLTSCFETKVNKRTAKETDPVLINPTPTPTYGPYPTPTPTSPPARPPYTFSPWVIHGNSGYGAYLWSTSGVGVPDQVMKTDSRFDVRIKKESAPAKDSYDSFNVKCHYATFPYTKLKGFVRIKVAGTSVYKTMAFETNSGTRYSEILRFGDLADFPITSGHYVIEVMTPVESDGGCQRSPGHPDVCPYWPVPHSECVSFSVEMATDYTNPF